MKTAERIAFGRLTEKGYAMNGSTKIRRLFALLLGTHLVIAASPASAAHLACKVPTFGFGHGASIEDAMQQARQNWRMSTVELHGRRYGFWHNSINPGRTCDRKQGLIYCKIWASPCR